jgi:hypothetical protein
MKKSRNNVFETNSSSCHSITFSDDVIGDLKGLTLYISGNGEYGWGPENLYNPEEKLDYALVAYLTTKTKWIPLDTTLRDLERVRSKLVSEMKTEVNTALAGVADCFRKHGVMVEWEDDIGEISVSSNYRVQPKYVGYIDHQSAPTEGGDSTVLVDWFENNPEKLYQFVFNNSYIVIDNDNH